MDGTDAGFFLCPFACHILQGLRPWTISVSAGSKRAIYCRETLDESFCFSLGLRFPIFKMGMSEQTCQGRASRA